jgi:hypothetical protein
LEAVAANRFGDAIGVFADVRAAAREACLRVRDERAVV